jgi:hypothetical protein
MSPPGSHTLHVMGDLSDSADRGAEVNYRTGRTLLGGAIIVGIVAGAAWYPARGELRQLTIGELKPIAALLKEDQSILLALQANSALQKDSGILASYLDKIRAGGLPKHADMKQNLDRLAQNNSAT